MARSNGHEFEGVRIPDVVREGNNMLHTGDEVTAAVAFIKPSLERLATNGPSTPSLKEANRQFQSEYIPAADRTLRLMIQFPATTTRCMQEINELHERNTDLSPPLRDLQDDIRMIKDRAVRCKARLISVGEHLRRAEEELQALIKEPDPTSITGRCVNFFWNEEDHWLMTTAKIAGAIAVSVTIVGCAVYFLGPAIANFLKYFSIKNAVTLGKWIAGGIATAGCAAGGIYLTYNVYLKEKTKAIRRLIQAVDDIVDQLDTKVIQAWNVMDGHIDDVREYLRRAQRRNDHNAIQNYIRRCLNTWDEINIRARALLEGQGGNVPDNNEEVPPNGQPEGLRHRLASLPEEAQQIINSLQSALNMRPQI